MLSHSLKGEKMRKIASYALVVATLLLVSGCASHGGRYFQQSEDRKVHVMKNRIYNPGDYRHERHDSGVASHVNDY